MREVDSQQPRKISTESAVNGSSQYDSAQQGSSATKSKKKKRFRLHPLHILGGLFRLLFNVIGCTLCLIVMVCCVGGVLLSMYVVQVTADDDEVLDLDSYELAQTSIVYDMNGDEYATWTGNSDRIWKSLAEMPVNLQNAVIAVEDKDFYSETYGINFKRTLAAVLNEFTGERLLGERQGASTLEQQLIKNLTGDNSIDIMRKVREIFRAIGISRRYSKETVLEAYLNTIPLTGTIGGMEVGANEYFGKTVSELDLAECATLASIAKSPTNYNPRTNPENLIQRRNYILSLMRNQGMISESECEAAQAEPLLMAEENSVTANSNVYNTFSSLNSWFTDALFEDVIDAIVENKEMTPEEARSIVYNGGLRIYSTVDPDLQSSLEEMMLDPGDKRFAPGWHEEAVNTSVNAETGHIEYDTNGWPIDADRDWAIFSQGDIPVYTNEEANEFKTSVNSSGNLVFYRRVRTQVSAAVLDYDGNIRAITGGLGEKKYDLALNRATVPHQTGSTMKPIGAYCLALENRIINYSYPVCDIPLYLPSDKMVLDTDKVRALGLSYSIYDEANRARDDIWKSWPENYNGVGGNGNMMLVWDALRQSYNTVAVQIGNVVGPDHIFDFVTNTLHCEHLIGQEEGEVTNDVGLAPMVLGSQSEGMTVVELAGAYSIFYDGSFTTPHYFTEIYDSNGNLFLDNTKNISTTQAIRPDTAAIMNRMLMNVLKQGGTASGMAPQMENGMESAAKTGTTQNGNDFTFVGLTPYYVTALWYGFDKPVSLYDYNIHYGTPIQQAWKDLMEDVQANLEYKTFPMPENVVEAHFDSSSGGVIESGGMVGYYTEDNMLRNEDLAAVTQPEEDEEDMPGITLPDEIPDDSSPPDDSTPPDDSSPPDEEQGGSSSWWGVFG